MLNHKNEPQPVGLLVTPVVEGIVIKNIRQRAAAEKLQLTELAETIALIKFRRFYPTMGRDSLGRLLNITYDIARASCRDSGT